MLENLCTSAKQPEERGNSGEGICPRGELLEEKPVQRMMCTICGHIYDPEIGDNGVPSGVAFENVPEGWSCPVCGAEKSKFIPSG